MVEAKFDHLEKRVLKLIDQNYTLSARITDLEREREALTANILQMQETFAEESDELGRKNDELTIHLRKIMSRLKSLSVQ